MYFLSVAVPVPCSPGIRSFTPTSRLHICRRANDCDPYCNYSGRERLSTHNGPKNRFPCKPVNQGRLTIHTGAIFSVGIRRPVPTMEDRHADRRFSVGDPAAAFRRARLAINIPKQQARRLIGAFGPGRNAKASRPCAILARLSAWILTSWRLERILESFIPKQIGQRRPWCNTSWRWVSSRM
jgi:hypothetical protein